LGRGTTAGDQGEACERERHGETAGHGLLGGRKRRRRAPQSPDSGAQVMGETHDGYAPFAELMEYRISALQSLSEMLL
jgi:hypothetical protein